MGFAPDNRPAQTDNEARRAEFLPRAVKSIDLLSEVQDRLTTGSKLYVHLEWAKEAAWAASYPGGPDDTLLNALEATADQAG